MAKQPLVMRKGQAQALKVLGADVQFVCEAASTGKAWSLMEVNLPKDAGPPPHTHEWDEAYYVIAGDVRFTLGTETIDVGAGDFLYAPGGTVHGFHGVSDEPARVLIFDAPAHAETFFKEVDRQVKGPSDFPKVPQIGAQHGIHFLPRS